MADVSGFSPVLNSADQYGNLMRDTASAQLQGAQTGLVGQQTQEAAMKNQIMRAQLPLALKMIQDYNVNSDASAEPPGPDHDVRAQARAQEAAAPSATSHGDEPWYDPARIDQGLRQRYFVNPAGTPQEIQGVLQGAMMSNVAPQFLERAKQARELGVQQRTAQSQADANNLYETMSAVANADDGRALDALAAVSPTAVAAIKKQIPDEMEEDAAARQYAAHVASTVHQYSGRPVEADTGGVWRDKVTGQPVTGVAATGMSAEQWMNAANHENELVDVPDGKGGSTKVNRYIAEGSKNLYQGIMKFAAQRGLPGASPTLTGAPAAQAQQAAQHAANTVGPAQPAGARAAAARILPPGAVPGPKGQPVPAAGTPLAAALQDNSFRAEALKPGTPMHNPNDIEKGVMDTYNKQRGELTQAGSDNALAASQALQNFQAAKAIMAAPDGSQLGGVIPGRIAQELAKLGFNTDTGAHRIEAAKYLTNAALANLKTVYGARPGVFDVKVNLEQAFPNVSEMNTQAIQDLIDAQIRNAAYIRDSAARIPMYVAAKNEPSSFNSWNEKYFSRTEAVNKPEAGGKTQPTGQPKYAKPEDVAADYKAGKISREQAKQFLLDQHGIK